MIGNVLFGSLVGLMCGCVKKCVLFDGVGNVMCGVLLLLVVVCSGWFMLLFR